MDNVLFIETLNETLIAHHNKRPHEEAHISFPETRGYFFHIELIHVVNVSLNDNHQMLNYQL